MVHGPVSRHVPVLLDEVSSSLSRVNGAGVLHHSTFTFAHANGRPFISGGGGGGQVGSGVVIDHGSGR